MVSRILTITSLIFVLFAAVLPASAEDERELVNLPPDVKAAFLAEMRGSVSNIESILAAIAEGDFKNAANIADIKMGFGHSRMESMAKQGMGTDEILANKKKMRKMGYENGEGRGMGQGMGRYMPENFRALGQYYHQVSEDLASIAREVGPNPTTKDFQTVIGALEDVTGACASCHQAFRVQ